MSQGPTRVRRVRALRVCALRVRALRVCVLCACACACRALPLYADGAQGALALVLCAGLDRAVSNLRGQPLGAHAVGAAWLEEDCVAIDPCAETGAGGAAAPRGAWLHGNTSALATAGAAAATAAAEQGVVARNFGSFEYARVPEGLVVRACAPDFDAWRKQGALVCDANTLVEVDTVQAARGCPRAGAYTLVDCLQPLQAEASVTALHWRAPEEPMHFGHRPWDEACGALAALAALPAVAAVLCNRSRDDFVVEVPKAAAAELARTSLVWYDFAPGYGCHAAPANASLALSRAAAPNRVVECAAVAHAVVWRSAADPTVCEFACVAPFVRTGAGAGAGCASPCAGLNATCAHAAESSCTDSDGARFFNCTACAAVAGFATRAFDAAEPAFACAYDGCVAGTASGADEHACTPCARNTVAAAAHAHACVPCNTSASGLFSREAGGTACEACFAGAGAEAAAAAAAAGEEGAGALCGAGRGFENDFGRVQALFALYAADRAAVRLEDFVEGYCLQGYACLPCAPGAFEAGGLCGPCGYGTYQHNFGATACFACAAGQNTTARGQNSSAACVCTPGFE